MERIQDLLHDLGMEDSLIPIATYSHDVAPDSVWESALKQLELTLDSQIFSAWIRPLKIVSCVNKSPSKWDVIIGAPNKFSCEHIVRHYSVAIAEALSRSLSVAEVNLSFQVFSSATVSSATAENKLPAAAKVARISLGNGNSLSLNSKKVEEIQKANLNERYNFSNFVVGNCNQLAYAVSLQVSENLGGTYNPLFIYGGVGLGKTHLANAIGNAAKRRKKKVLLVSSESFVTELISSLRSNNMDKFRSKFRSIDLLIVDDIQFIIGKERTQEEFFHTFNELFNSQKQIVITSDKLPNELTGLEERLKTRFACGISVDLQTPDFETRVAIVGKKASQLQFGLPEEVARIVAQGVTTNVRELEGALNKLMALCSMKNCSPNEQLALEITVGANRSKKNITPEAIMKVVAEKYRVSVHDIVGKRRTQNIAFARQVAMYLCREHTNCSYPELGVFFGGRDHSTVIHAKKVINDKIGRDEGFQDEIKKIINEF